MTILHVLLIDFQCFHGLAVSTHHPTATPYTYFLCALPSSPVVVCPSLADLCIDLGIMHDSCYMKGCRDLV